MKHLLFVCLFSLLPLMLFAQGPSKIVTAHGEGNSKDQALDQAKRNAVEQGLGTVVSSETITKNYQLANDAILSRANGFVKNYKEVSCSQKAGYYTVVIEAEITQIFDEILKDQQAIDMLLLWMNKPRVMIMVDEMNNGEKTTACETELAKKLGERHFDLISQQQVNALRSQKQAQDALAGNYQAAAALANNMGAELLLIGKALAKEISGLAYLEGTGMKSVQGDFSAQIISASDGQILASYTTHDKAVHISPVTGGVQALTKASDEMADSLVAYLLKRGSETQVNARTFSLIVKGIGFRELNLLKTALSNVPSVSNVGQRSFKAPEGELAVDYYGKANDLAMALDGLKIEGGKFAVEEISGNNITLQFIGQ